MTVSVVLAAVLGIALLGAVAALILSPRTSPEGRPASRRAPGAAVTGRVALEDVDLGLRVLAAACERGGRELPDTYVVVSSDERLVLRLARFDRDAPVPWESDEDGEEWSLARKSLTAAELGPQPDHPFPLTVTLGFQDGERVLVDLARAAAPIALTGSTADARRLAAAFVAEVLTGPVGRRGEVTLVGSGATALADELGVRSARLRTAASLKEALAQGAEEGTAFTLLPDDGVTEVFQLIEGDDAGQGGAPAHRLFVMDAAHCTEEGRPMAWSRTDALLLLGDVPAAAWRFAAGADGALDTGPLGLRIDRAAGHHV
ncbi:hypothetical protein OHB31_03590 [Streptomyces microflavus]|uniref:hypothetical protein n=1 Tax=Streptomyces microflavus TaxID=1919 RepID=UPI002DD89F3A|nr:hypothetical protein [Streptomyces microflavus]WSA59295.1 hypothetical protein OHB31_03590 [Streptomyces microflavus]